MSFNDYFNLLQIARANDAKWLMEKVSSAKRFKALESNDGIKRVTKELSIIAKGGNAHMIRLVYMLSSYCKKHNEPFLLYGPLASLYVFYLLEVSKFNPLATGSRPETLLGTYNNPKSIDFIEIGVRPSFEDELYSYCASKEKIGSPYAYFQDIDGSKHYKLRFLDQDSVEKEETETRAYVPFKVLKDPLSHIDEGIGLSIVPLTMLDEAKKVLDDNPDIDYRSAIDQVHNVIAKDNLYDINEVASHFIDPDKPYEEELLNAIISFLSFFYFFYEGDKVLAPFYDRDSVFNYLKAHGYGSEDAYQIMERLRKGKPVEDEMLARIPKRDKEKLTHCRYLCPRAYSSELAFYYLLLATKK